MKIDIVKLFSKLVFFNQVYDSALVIQGGNGKIYLIMPKLPGKKLSDLDYEQMTPEEYIRVIRACLISIDHMHEKGIAHNDLHEDNILYDHTTQQAYLIDFGLSQFITNANEQEYLRFLLYFFLGKIDDHMKFKASLKDFYTTITSKLNKSIEKLKSNAFAISEFVTELQEVAKEINKDCLQPRTFR